MALNHPLAAKEHLCIADLREETFFASNSFMGMQDIITKYCKKAGFKPSIRYWGNSIALISELVSEGEGIAFISEKAFGCYNLNLEDGATESRALTDDKRIFGIAILKNRILTKAAADFYFMIVNRNFEADMA
jgi:DNA-binding transcriptional LysR family regulator